MFKTGDRVTFNARGKKIVGTITRVRTKTRKGRVRELALLVTGDPHSLDREVAEIAPDGGGAVWTVALSSLTLLGKGDLAAARAAVNEVKNARRANENRRATANFETADAGGLYDLKLGAAIEVKFRDIGWAAATFRGFVAGSGNVRYERGGRVRTSAPEFVRKPM